MKRYTILAFSALLIGCASSAPKTGSYIASEGTVHSLYPSQFTGSPVTPNQRVQVNGRGEYTAPSYTCLMGSMSANFIGNMVSFSSISDKKTWPEYGYVTNRSQSKAADGTNNIKIFFTVEGVKGQNRNAESGDFTNSLFELDFNDEIQEDKWMHGKSKLSGVFVYFDHKIYGSNTSVKYYDMKCTTLNVETSVNLTTTIALKTMTIEQIKQITEKD
jgi:hypothetical protein